MPWPRIILTASFKSQSRTSEIGFQFKRTLRNSLARNDIDAEPSVIEMLDVNGTTSKSSDEINVANIEQVIFLASEARMGLLLDLEDNITSLDAGRLITLASELNLGTTSDTAVNVNVEDLSVNNSLLAIALLAAILLLDDLTLSVTVGADSLESLDHRAHLAHHGLHTMTITARTPLNSTLLATVAIALGADDGPLQGQLGDLASVDILERDLVSVVNSSGLGRSTLVHTTKHATEATSEAAAAEELSKQVLGSHTATGASFKTSLAILVVDLSLLGVGKDLVGVGNFLELLLGSGVVGVLVWEKLDGFPRQ